MDIDDILEQHNIKPTAVRVLIYREIQKINRVFSLSSLEDILKTVDKSTIFRTLTLFQQNHLIHTIDDGSGSVKYSMCGNNCCLNIDELHPHFHCEQCQNTFCLTSLKIPPVSLPNRYHLSSINFVLKGICPACGN
ncbi:MAG: transcriptional repressor [Bacteroidales bacterium]|nr:MAG: transcriptional repressor [Bacteroidales bacterium]